MTSQSAAADESEAITAKQTQQKRPSNDSTGLFKTKMFWDPKTNRPDTLDVPSEPIFTQNARQFSESSQKSMTEAVKILNTRSWVDLEANLYCIIIEFLIIPENWKIIKGRVPILTDDSICFLLKDFGNDLRDAYINELHTTVSECLGKQKDEEEQFRRLHIAVNLVMTARYFAVVATSHQDVIFEGYKNQLKERNSKYFSLYPDMANVIKGHWEVLASWCFSGLSQPSMVNLMTFFSAMASYTTPSRAASAMEQCRDESCAFCSDYRILSPPKPTSMPKTSAVCQ